MNNPKPRVLVIKKARNLMIDSVPYQSPRTPKLQRRSKLQCSQKS